jgi:hypothetical protein
VHDKDAYENPLGFQQGLDPDPAANDDMFQQQMREVFDLNMAIAVVKKTEAGKKLFAFLRTATIESAAWSPALAQQAGIDAANAHAYAREGQNALVRDLESRAALAEKVRTPEELFDLIKGVK